MQGGAQHACPARLLKVRNNEPDGYCTNPPLASKLTAAVLLVRYEAKRRCDNVPLAVRSAVTLTAGPPVGHNAVAHPSANTRTAHGAPGLVYLRGGGGRRAACRRAKQHIELGSEGVKVLATSHRLDTVPPGSRRQACACRPWWPVGTQGGTDSCGGAWVRAAGLTQARSD